MGCEKQVTEEQLRILKSNVKQTINSLYKELFIDMVLDKNLNDCIQDSTDTGDTDIEYIKNVIKVHSNICTQLMYIYVHLRTNFGQTLAIEKKYTLRHCVVNSHELYKYLYGFDYKTLWKTMEKQMSLIYQQEYEVIKAAEIEYKNNFANKDKYARDVSEHFSNEIQEFYEVVSTFTEREVVDRVLAILKLVQPIHEILTKELMNKLGKKYISAYLLYPPILNLEGKGELSDADSSFTINALLKFSDIVKSTNTNMFRVENESKKPKYHDCNIKRMVDWDFFYRKNVNIHILYVYLDFITLYRAFMNSEEFVENKLNLACLQMSAHEGFKKLYGFNNKNENSYWNRAIKAEAMKFKDDKLNSEIDNIEAKLKRLSTNEYICDESIALAITHSGPDSKKHIEAPRVLLDYFQKQVSKNEIATFIDFMHVMHDVFMLYDNIMKIKGENANINIFQKLHRLEEFKEVVSSTLNNMEKGKLD